MKIIPVILSGGSGTRLWPLSRKQHPKQYLSLAGEKTMLQETITRLDGLNGLDSPIIVCNVDHRFLVAEQCQQIGVKDPVILLEPVGRNTAPAITAATLQSLKSSNNPILLVLSADHIIQDTAAFHKAINIASNQAQKGKLVTFGIMPLEANTGYGYIRSSKKCDEDAYLVEEFVEKPDSKTAQFYIDQGNYFWNSGMFMFKSDTLIEELNTYSQKIVDSVKQSINNAVKDLDFIRLDRSAFESSPSDSIDYALMEKSKNVVVVPLDADWSDVGSWSALHNIGKKDCHGNVFQGDVIAQNTSNTYINACHHLVAAIGVENLVVVDTPDATLIVSQNEAQGVKAIVNSLSKSKRSEGVNHRKVYRPWGWFDSIESGENFQVKKLHVNPGAKLSLQRHFKRAEHWVVVRGVANVVKGNESLELQKGQSVYIDIGEKHSLKNKGDTVLEVIEVQSGEYLGEDDIQRFEDIYGRK